PGGGRISREQFWEDKESIFSPMEHQQDFYFGKAVEKARSFGSNLVDLWYDTLSQLRDVIARKEAKHVAKLNVPLDPLRVQRRKPLPSNTLRPRRGRPA